MQLKIARAVLCLLVTALCASPAAAQLPAPWANRDIGATGVAGSATESAGNFTVRGAGSDIWLSSDQFHFVYQPVTGDVDLRAYVAGLEYVNEWTKGGVMIRESLDPRSRHASTFVTPTNGLVFHRRVLTEGNTTNTAGPRDAAPHWVRIVRAGNQFTSYVSDDGTSWSLVGSETITMSSTVQVGLAVVSKSTSRTAMASFANVTVNGTGTSTPTTTLWANRDVGSPALAGRASESGGTFSVTGAGADIWSGSDQFHYMYQPVSGDVEIVARVAGLQYTDGWAKAGVMIRESLTGPAAHALMAGTPASGWAFQRRPVTSGGSVHSPGTTGAPPGWVRLVRAGSTFSGYQSADGVNWVLVGTETIAMPAAVYVGLAVTSHNVSATSTATFTNVTVRVPSAPANQPPAVTLTAPASNSTFTAPATVALAATASDADGTVSRVEFFAGTQQVGSDSSSPYSATWSSVPQGTYQVTAVAVDNAGARTTSATATITVNAATSAALPAPWTNRDVGSPSVAGRASESSGTFSVTGAGADIWGTADQFHFMYQSFSGDVEIVARLASLQNTNSWAKGGVMIRETLSANSAHALMAGTAANGWAFQRRATTSGTSVHTSGPTGVAPGWVKLTRTGSSIAAHRSADGVNWTLVGTQTITMAQSVYVGLAVTSHNVSTASTATFTNVSVRTPSAPANTPPTSSITSPSNGATFTAPASITINASATDSNGSVTRVDFFNGTQLLGSDTSAAYSYTWGSVAAGAYSLTAVAYDNAGASTASAAVSVTVGGTTTPVTRVTFTPSPDHSTTSVTAYTVAIRRAVDAVTATPVATKDLGKPAPVNGEIVVDISDIVNPLAAGSYYAVVTAAGPGGSGASSPSATFTK